MCHGGPEINYTMPTPDRIESTETCAMLPHMITDWLEAGNLYGATATDAGWMLVQYEIPKEECRIEGAQVIVSEYGYVNSPVDSVIIFEFPLDSDVNGD